MLVPQRYELAIDLARGRCLRNHRMLGFIVWLAPCYRNAAALVVGWLTPVRGGEIVDTQNIALLPSAENHVLMDGVADCIHLTDRDGLAIPKGGVEGHRVSEDTILDKRKDPNNQRVQKESYVSKSQKGKPKLYGERRPMENIRVIKPCDLPRLWVPLVGLVNPFLDKGIVLLPLNRRSIFFQTNPFHVINIIRSKELGPSKHSANIKGPGFANLLVRSGVLDLAGGKFVPKFGRQILVYFAKVAQGRLAARATRGFHATEKKLSGWRLEKGHFTVLGNRIVVRDVGCRKGILSSFF